MNEDIEVFEIDSKEVVRIGTNLTGFKNHTRATRTSTKLKCIVNSIGEGFRFYNFSTRNISETGLYIIGDKNKYEYQKSSILELVLLTPNDQISLLAKPVRFINSNEYGLRIVQIDKSDSVKLRRLIYNLTKNKSA